MNFVIHQHARRSLKHTEAVSDEPSLPMHGSWPLSGYLVWLLALLSSLSLCSRDSYAATLVWLDTPHDHAGARSDCHQRLDVAKRQVMLRRLERKLLDGVMSKHDLIAKYGMPMKVQIDDRVRPLGADDIISPELLKPSESNQMMERALYFQLNETAVMLVFTAPDGNPYKPAVLYWKAADDLPKMVDAAVCDQRLSWEAPRLAAILSLVNSTAAELTPSDEELQQTRVDSMRLRKHMKDLSEANP